MFDAEVAQVSALIGQTDDVTRFLLCCIANIPLGFLFFGLFLRVPSIPRNLVHIVSMSAGIFQLVFCFGPYGWVHLFVSSTVVMLFMHFLSKQRGLQLSWLWAVGYLSALHIHRLWTDWGGYTLDVSGPQMVATIKLTAYAWNILDGQRSAAALQPYHAAHCIKPEDSPSPLQFYGFIFYFPSLLVGPGIEFMDYLRLVNAVENRSPLPSFPALLGATAKKLLATLAVAPFILLQPYFPHAALLRPEWAALSLPRKLLDTYVSSLLLRTKYYFAWSLSDVGFTASAFSYQAPAAKDAAPKWDAVKNVDVLAIEYPAHFGVVPTKWNILTHYWLKFHVFFRVPGDKGHWAAPLTYMVSAFWHGFYPSYYFAFATFFLIGLADAAFSRGVVARFRDRSDALAKTVRFLHSALVIWLTSYAGIIFSALSPSETFQYMTSMYFVGHLVLVPMYLIGTYLTPRRSSTSSTASSSSSSSTSSASASSVSHLEQNKKLN